MMCPTLFEIPNKIPEKIKFLILQKDFGIYTLHFSHCTESQGEISGWKLSLMPRQPDRSCFLAVRRWLLFVITFSLLVYSTR